MFLSKKFRYSNYLSIILRNEKKCLSISATASETNTKSCNKIKVDSNKKLPDYIDLKIKSWPMNNELKTFCNDMVVLENFLSIDEEEQLIKEVDPHMKRLRYEFDHWDDAIHGFRETERKNWYPNNKIAIDRVAKAAFDGLIMPYIHVLDLAKDGVIKPHVDSSRYCGTTIAGLSLLSDCVMRLVRTDERKYLQGQENDNRDSIDTKKTNSDDSCEHFFADILLRRRSLYIMKNTARYNFTHEILSGDMSKFKEEIIKKDRRISIICRNKP